MVKKVVQAKTSQLTVIWRLKPIRPEESNCFVNKIRVEPRQNEGFSLTITVKDAQE